MINSLIDLVLKYPKRVVVLFSIFFVLSLACIPFLEQVSDVSQLVSEEDEVIVFNQQMEEVFGSSRLTLVRLDEAFSTDKLRDAKEFVSQLEGHPDVTDVVSIFSEKYLSGAAGSFEVEDIVADIPSGPESINELKVRLASFPLYEYALWKKSSLNFLVQFNPKISDQDQNKILTTAIEKQNFSDDYSVSGWPEINNSIKGSMDRDLFVLVPLIFVVITIIFFYLFGSIRGVIMPLLTIVFAIVGAVGFMAISGISLNVVTNSIPLLLVAIGTSDGIHYLTKYYFYAPEYTEHNKLISKATKIIAPTILLTSLTTMGGFLANLFSPVVSISEFGLVTAVGVFLAGIASYLLVPALLTYFKTYPVKQKRHNHDETFEILASRLFSALKRFKWQLTAVLFIIFGFCGFQISSLEANYTLLGYFSPESKVVKDALKVAETSGGLIEFNIVVDTKEKNGLIDSQVLKSFEQARERILEKYPQDIVYMTSLADYIKNMSKAYNGADEYYRIPENNDAIAQYLEVYSWSGEVEEDLKYVTDPTYKLGRIYGRFKLQLDENGKLSERNLRYYERVVQEIQSDLENSIEKPVEVRFYGELPMWISTLYKLVEGQINSVLVAMLIVFLMALPILRSLKLTLIGLIPIAFAVCFNFAFMSIFKIQLDIATSLVSAIAIGIGIDDALHFLLTYKRLLPEHKNSEEALLATLKITGKAIFATSVTLVLGYVGFLFSSFKPVNHFGLLNIMTITMATIATIVAIPLAILIFKPKLPGDS